MKKGVFLMSKKSVSTLTDWRDYKTALDLSQDEWDEIALKVKIVGEIIAARESQAVTQQDLETLSGVRQPVIARLERNNTDPRLTTILKILRPLGKTLAIVPLEGESVATNRANV